MAFGCRDSTHMEESSLPAEVQAFLRERMESYEQLEVLLLLRARPDDAWAANAVGSELHMPEAAADHSLRALSRHGLLSVAASPKELVFSYRPESAELAALVEKLAGAYTEQRIEVVRLMTTNSIDRLRAGALRTFANAFILGKKGGKGG